MADDLQAIITVDESMAKEKEYPTCYKCGSPLVLFIYTSAIGVTKVCSGESCERGLEKMYSKQVPGTKINKCIKSTGIHNLQKQLDECLDMLNRYREDHDLPSVDNPRRNAKTCE